MTDYNYNDRRSYNNAPLKDGQAMVPIYVTWEMVKYYDMDPDNLETWNIKGHKVLVAFDIVKEEDKANAIKVFWKDVRDYMKQDKPDPMLCSYEELTEPTADDHYSENKSYEPQEMPSLERTVLLQQIIDELIKDVRAIDPNAAPSWILSEKEKKTKTSSPTLAMALPMAIPESRRHARKRKSFITKIDIIKEQ